jgi:molecular chaperone GrpE (heat shock protein)
MAEDDNGQAQENADTDIKQDTENIPTTIIDQTIGEKSDSDEILSYLKENAVTLNEIKETIKERLDRDAVKEKAFDKLYEEMQRQRESAAMLDRAVKPMLTDLLLLYDSLKKFEILLNTQGNDIASEICLNFRFIIDELLESLYRQEVLLVNEEDKITFNSKIQRAIKTVESDNIDDDYKVVSISRDGFTWRGKIIRPQEVVIKRYFIK